MRGFHLAMPFRTVLAIFFFWATAWPQSTGYWKLIKLDSGIYNGGGPTAPTYDTLTGGETNVTLTKIGSGPAGPVGCSECSNAALAVNLRWYTPPNVLIPGTILDWRVSGTVLQNTSPSALINPPASSAEIDLKTNFCGYKPDPNEDGSGNCGGDSMGIIHFYQTPSNVPGNDPVGTVKTFSNLQQTPPTKVTGNQTGMMTLQVVAFDAWGRDWIWHYQYQWVASSLGTGSATLGSSGQNIGMNGGPGSVTVAATSSWSVSTPDSWITITSPTTGTGNSTVTFTVQPNTGTSRMGTLIIGGVPYYISQDGTGTAPSNPNTLDLHRPKLVVTDSAGTNYTLQPAPGKNDGTDDGSANAGKDTGAFGQTSGGWQSHNFSKESPVFLMSSTCNDSSGYAYLQFSLAGLPLQNVSTAKVQVYVGSTVVGSLAPIASDPVFAARRVTSAWDETKLTWSSGQPTFDPAVVDQQTLTGVAGVRTPVSGWLSYDVTSLYKGWANGSTPNYGLRFSHENGSCLNGWLGQFYTSNDQPAATTGGACAFSLSLSAAAMPATGGNGAFTTSASGTTCSWTVGADVPWLHVSSASSNNGTGTVLYTADANTGIARTGTITVKTGGSAITFTVSQAAGNTGPPTGPSSCTGTCTLSSPGQPVATTGGPGSVAVTATSSWTAVAIDSWIHLTSSANNTGNSSVTFTVDANTGIPRTGTISIANQTYTIFQNGTPTGTNSGCAYLIQSSTTQNVANTGTTSGLVQVVTAQTCPWTATTSTSWITLRSGISSTGNGAVAYAVPQNDTANPRSGAIVIAGQNIVVNQAGGTIAPPPGTPVVSAGGVVNTASYAPGGPPNGSLAQGSFFSIYGASLGPDTPAQATSYPLPSTLGGVSVQIVQGTNKYSAPLVFAYSGQINAILPSNVPVGAAQLTVTYNGLTSTPATITVAKTSLGLFFQKVGGKDLAIAQNVKSQTEYPLNLPDTPAKPGQIVIFWGTGLGPITGADNTAPGGSAGDMVGVPVTITVGGVTAQRLYAGRQAETAGVDNIYVTIPAGVPFGCQVPVAITAGGVAANTTLLAVTADGSPCQ